MCGLHASGRTSTKRAGKRTYLPALQPSLLTALFSGWVQSQWRGLEPQGRKGVAASFHTLETDHLRGFLRSRTVSPPDDGLTPCGFHPRSDQDASALDIFPLYVAK